MEEIARIFDEIGFVIETYHSIDSRRLNITFVISGTKKQIENKTKEFVKSLIK